MGTVVFIRERRSHGKRYIKAAISEISQRNISLPLLFVQKQQSCGGSFAGNFLKALLSLPDDHTNMRAWLYLVARNLFFNYYRREKEKVPLGEVQQIQNTASQEVLEGILKEEKNRLLYQAMNELEERKREILLMQYFGGLSQKEIAAILKMTPEMYGYCHIGQSVNCGLTWRIITMTYRELLKLYQEGKLDKAQTDEVEHAIEKQEAISEYLYEKEEIPGLEVLQGQEKEEVFVQGNDAESEEEQRFVKMIQKTIRRTFLKMGAIVGAGVLAIVLCVIFVLPQVVSAFYYNPNEVVGIGEGSDNITTTRMSLDLSVYSELFWPGSYRNTVNAVADGYGTYNISIPQGISYDGKFTTVNGRLKRGKLTLYNTDEFKMPYGNTFMVPKEVEEYSRMHFSTKIPDNSVDRQEVRRKHMRLLRNWMIMRITLHTRPWKN